MFRTLFFFAAAATLAIGLSFLETPTLATEPVALSGDGVVRVKSAYPMDETIDRLKADIAAKGILFFNAIDQAKLAGDAGIDLRPSTLLIFGNPPLGTLFITAKAEAGLDWPVRLLVSEDAQGQVWAIYTDFAWIAQRHGIVNRQAEFAKAAEVIASITGSVAK
jgi:uncharacterized protein (DUF302 family)